VSDLSPHRAGRGLLLGGGIAMLVLANFGERSELRVDGVPVGGGAPGPVTLRLREAYWELHKDPRFATPVQYD
jgi:hypothetical protein